MTTIDDDAVFVRAVKGVQRVTRVGQMLRSTNIDELPQLLNVLLGHMSIVSPRPHAIRHNERFSNEIIRFTGGAM